MVLQQHFQAYPSLNGCTLSSLAGEKSLQMLTIWQQCAYKYHLYFYPEIVIVWTKMLKIYEHVFYRRLN